MSKFMFPMSLMLMCTTTGRTKNSEVLAAIEATARNYMESWYRGDAKRMKASLHKKLSKRSLKGCFGEPGVRHTTASDMIRYTENGHGINLRPQGLDIDVIVLDYTKNIASVKVIAPHYYEYLHLAKVDDKWVILNALYEKKSPTVAE